MSFYDHYARQGATAVGQRIKRWARRRQMNLIVPFLPDTSSAVLEIGPGFGDLADLFLEAGYSNYTGVEPNALLRTQLSARGIKVKDYRLPHLLEEDQAYDAIMLFHVFEHLDGPGEARAFMSEAARVLRPGGLLCILAPDYLHWSIDFFNGDYTHSNITTARRAGQLFADNGFHILACTYFSGFFSGRLATLISRAVGISLFFSHGEAVDDRLYRVKTSFLRSFFIIGRKRPEQGRGIDQEGR